MNEDSRTGSKRQRRQRLLAELLDRLDREHGPVDKELVDKYVALLRRSTTSPWLNILR